MPRGKPNYVDPIRKGGPTRNVTKVKQRPKTPVVYFIRAETGLIKIGHTNYIASRMVTLVGQSPVTLELLATVHGSQMDERAYHARFAAHRAHGEWFEPAPAILEEIARLKGDMQ